MKKYIPIIAAFVILISFSACDRYWEEHYDDQPETVEGSVWDALKSNPDVSMFVELIGNYKLDSVFQYNDVHTLFVPNNKAVKAFLDSAQIQRNDVAYHILRHFIMPANINGKKKIQTLRLKFAQFENRNNEFFFDEIPISFVSPLYADGRFFVIDQVAMPNPSLYEYIALTNPALKLFIDSQDSIILDKERSKPLSFDDQGNTIYDSIITVINLFEEEFFEVSTEFRQKTATLVFPRQALYEQALTNMAIKLGGNYTSHEDIAMEWQQEILIPYLLKNGVFENMREEIEFKKDTIKNILGDSIRIRFTPADKILCSNGYGYNYKEFEVLDSLFMSPIRNEGEWLLDVIGKERYAWKKDVVVTSTKTFTPAIDFISTASNDSILRVVFDKGYTGNFSIEFETKALFPRKYLAVVRTHMDIGGIYDIYINDELVKTFNYYDYVRFRDIMPSTITGKRFINQGRYNKFDFWVNNITEYGRAKVRFVYKGTGNVPNQGLVIDYIDFVPESMTDLITKNP